MISVRNVKWGWLVGNAQQIKNTFKNIHIKRKSDQVDLLNKRPMEGQKMWPMIVRWAIAGAAAYVGMELAKSFAEGIEYSWTGRPAPQDKEEKVTTDSENKTN